MGDDDDKGKIERQVVAKGTHLKIEYLILFDLAPYPYAIISDFNKPTRRNIGYPLCIDSPLEHCIKSK